MIEIIASAMFILTTVLFAVGFLLVGISALCHSDKMFDIGTAYLCFSASLFVVAITIIVACGAVTVA